MKDFAYRDLSISKEEFCDLNVIRVKLLDKILIQSVIYDEISKKLYKKIQSNSLNTSSNYSSFILFMLLEEFRCRANSGESLNINDVYNSIFNTIKKYISNPETVLRQLSFDVKDGELVIK